jgi:hypothetical protein
MQREESSFDVRLRSTGFLSFEIIFQYQRNPARCQRTTVSGVTTRRDCFQPDQHRRTSSQKSLSNQSSLGVRMTPLEHDELLTKCKIFEKKTVTRTKEANQRSEAESKETEHGGEL